MIKKIVTKKNGNKINHVLLARRAYNFEFFNLTKTDSRGVGSASFELKIFEN
jgi:hypothetical protein